MRGTLAILALVLAAGAARAQSTAAPSPEVRRVLTVFTDDRLLPANQQIDDALRAALDRGPYRINYFAEFLDAARFPIEANGPIVRAYLANKYASQPPDLIFAAARSSLDFFLDARDTLFPGVPIVYVGLAADEVPTERLDRKVVGLPGAWEIEASLELARQLHPERTNVFVISGTSSREAGRLKSFRATAPKAHPGLRFTWWNRLTVAELETAAAALPADAVILFDTFYEDAAGQFYVPREVVRRVSQAAGAPVYGPFESYIGFGAVGGTVETWEATGRTAAELALKLLAGENPQTAVDAMTMPRTTIVDWRQIERWRVDPARLPVGTEIRFRQPTLWEAYRSQVIIAIVVGVAQLLLIAALAVALQRRRAAEATRRQAESRAAQLRTELAHAGRVTLLGELAATLAHELNQPLAAILSNAQATRRWLKHDQPNLAEVRTAVDDIITDDKRAGEIIHRMRGLLKKEERARTRVDVGKAVSDVANLVHGALIAADVKLQLALPPEPALVDGNEVEIQQVLLNLMTNSIQSIQESSPPLREVHVETRSHGGHVVVTVRDTGRGIPADVRERLFEPFFTTKTRGLGVGLNVCRRIAEAHGGRLELAESPTGGATFEFSLPEAVPA